MSEVVSHRRPERHNRIGVKRGFTLIELLVVIAIIAILAAILFPVFARARENARRASCQSNLKQIGLGIMQYTQDYDEKYPGGINGDWWQRTWTRTVQPYLKSVQVLRCPSDPGGTLPAAQSWAGPRVSYATNGYTRWNSSISDNEMAGVIGRQESWLKDPAVSLASVNRPAETIMATEKAHVWTGESTVPGCTYEWGPGCIITNGTASAYSSDLIPDGTRAATADPKDPNSPTGAVYPIHFDTANFLFADGHVKAMRPLQTNPDPVNRPADNMWDAKRS